MSSRLNMPAWFIEWASAHAVAFGLSDKCLATMLAWGPVWSHFYAAEELADATRRMTVEAGVPRFAADQRGVILGHVQRHRERANRAKAIAAEAGAAGTGAGCTVCGGTGSAIVPHPGLAPGGGWVGYLTVPNDSPDSRVDRMLLSMTCAVCCCCEAGRRTREGSEAYARAGAAAGSHHRKPMMTLVDYELRYPNWREVERARAALLDYRERPPTADELAAAQDTVARLSRRAAGGMLMPHE